MSNTKQPSRQVNAEDFKSYAGSGWQPIPLHFWNATSKDKRGKVRQDGKRPRDNAWTTTKYDPAKIIAHCSNTGCNMGIRTTKRRVVFDIDPRNGGDKSFDRFCPEYGLDPTTLPSVVTGSGGRHYYALVPEGVSVRAMLDGYPGMEIKSAGHQVVAAGSRHPNGNLYEWDFLAPALSEAPELPASVVEAIRRPAPSGETVDGGQYTEAELGRALATLDPTEFRDHDKWFPIMCASHHATGGHGRAEFISWCVSDPQYADDEYTVGHRWDSLDAKKPGAITYKTLNKILADAGAANAQPAPKDAGEDFEAVEVDDDDTSTDIVPVEARGFKISRNIAPDTFENACCAVTHAKISPAFNELTQTVVMQAETLPWPESYGRELTEHVLRLLRLYLLNKHQGIAYQPGKDHLFEAVMTMAYTKKFNPVLVYLDSLTWDGTERVARLFPDYFSCADDAYTRAVSQCYMVGAVRRMRYPGSKFDTMPVLKGRQGIGKSTGVRKLFGDDWYSDSDLGSLKDKDASMKLRGLWVHEFSEFDSLTRAEAGVLKAFLSSAEDKQRDPYDKVTGKHPRRNVHFGTVNEGGYLKDPTGGRRFWPLHATKPIDIPAIIRDRDQLWAEASKLEAARVSDVLPSKLWAIAAEYQANETSADPWVDLLRVFLDQRSWEHAIYDPADPAEDADKLGPPPPPRRVLTTELFAALDIKAESQTRDKAQRLRTAMEAGLGWSHRKAVRVGSDQLAGYVLKETASE